MSVERSKHDQFVKFMMSQPEIAPDFLKRFIPKRIFKSIDLSTLKIEPTSFIDEMLKKSESDILLSAQRNKIGQLAYFYILIEHQSMPDPKMPIRLLFYITQFYKRYLLDHDETHSLPLLYSKILYNGSQPWNYALNVASFFEKPEDIHDQDSFIGKMFLGPFDLLDVGRMSLSDLEQASWSNLMLSSLHWREKTLTLHSKMQLLDKLLRDLKINKDSPIAYAVLNYNLTRLDCDFHIYCKLFKET